MIRPIPLLGFVGLGIFAVGCPPTADTTATGTGGKPGAGTGGVVGTATGGVVGSGGALGSGGAIASGGATGTGGRVATGGATGTGGRANTGGVTGRGGRANSRGTTATGGVTGVGGGGGALAKFSFFVTSWAAIKKLSNSNDGFGGDLSFGETGEGAGLRGADKICTTIAETSMPGSGIKGWHAFLSAPTGGTNGGAVNAIDRIGSGPWYDRMGRLFSANKANLIGFRPSDADPMIKNDFPNEDGVPNHNPDGTGQVDNHDTLTGSGADGKLYTGTSNPTCSGWTSKVGSATGGKPRVGHAWPRTPSTNNTCVGGGTATAGCYGHWMSSLDEGGCAPGVNLMEMGGPMQGVYTVGTGGGFGGFFCFATTP
jgi:hypothetical protein